VTRHQELGTIVLFVAGHTDTVGRAADEVDEPRNRRADYIVAFEEPAIPAVGFRPAWQRLK
jgi:hypothetical protein